MRSAAVITGLTLMMAACAEGPQPVSPWVPLDAPGRPAGCDVVGDVAALRAALADERRPRALCLADGVYPGPLTLEGAVTLWGGAGAVLRSSGEGTTVSLHGEGPALLGVTVDGSGGRFDTLDAAVHVKKASDVRVEGVTVVHAVFGILVEQSKAVVVRGNHVVGDASSPVGLRGDGIRLWEARGGVVEGNRVEHSRDLVVWYSSGNRIIGNLVTDGRYGTHFMYSHENDIEANHYLRNEVGIFLMYSRHVRLVDNLLADATGAAGMGLGLKESGDVTAIGNRFWNDTVGLYLDTSPLQLQDANRFERNDFRLSESAVVFHSSEKRNAFVDNAFRDNMTQVQVEGGGDALGVRWEGNAFDDYQGYDLDGDGVGDVPYELRSLSSDLVSRYPDLAFFRGTVALSMVSAAGEMMPLLQPRPILRDERPRMGPPFLEAPRAR